MPHCFGAIKILTDEILKENCRAKGKSSVNEKYFIYYYCYIVIFTIIIIIIKK